MHKIISWSLTLFALGAGWIVHALPAAAAADIVFENESLRLEITPEAMARSLIVKVTGEECLETTAREALFATTQNRPFNNETKLAWPNKRTTYLANRVRREGDRLIVGFEIVPYEAVVKVTSGGGYFAFTLEKFLVDSNDEHHYRGLDMDAPPVVDFRLMQLPVRPRRNFGVWLNSMWDERAAVAVIAADPYVDIDSERRKGYRMLTADLHRGIELEGGTAVIAAGAGKDVFLESVAAVEEDYNLPRGVKSRRDPLLNASIYHCSFLWPENVDEHIARAKKGGFRLMLIYVTAMTKYPSQSRAAYYETLGDYDWNEHYPNGEKDLKAVLDKIRAAGIVPGLHTLQTHIGIESRYVTPVADPRLNKTRRFTLAREIPAAEDIGEIAVFENPTGSVMHPRCRVLQFGGELFSYEKYTTARPYRFTGVRRGTFKTRSAAHPCGEIGGILDISEFCSVSCYIDQSTDLQDEVAIKIKRICDQGMGFCYFDGSEGVNPPCGIYVALAQYRVLKTFRTPPLFTEGAAKSHFGWHFQAGANAFDCFSPDVFKEKIIEYPCAEAPLMRKDFTRVDFGWWNVVPPRHKNREGKETVGTQPDMWEYGTSKAAAWDCPVSIQFGGAYVAGHPRLNDLLETMRRWEDVRVRNWLTSEQKEMLKDPKREFHLHVKSDGDYDLVEWRQLAVGGKFEGDTRAFVFRSEGKTHVLSWPTYERGEAKLTSYDKPLVEVKREWVSK